MKRIVPIVLVAAALVAVFLGPSDEPTALPESASEVAAVVETPEPAYNAPIRQAHDEREPVFLGLPPGSAALPQRPETLMPPQRDLMADADVVEAMYFNFPDLGECHRILRELEPTTPSELTFLFELIVERDPEAEFGAPRLQSITAGDLAIEEVACFAEVLEELPVPQPETGERYAASLQVSMRTD
jgi:hypothetical protein